MKKLVFIMIYLIAGLVAYGQQESIPTPNTLIDHSVLVRHDDFREALIRENVPALEKLLADDFILTGSDGKMWCRQQIVELVRDEVLDHHAITYNDIQVKANEQEAVITGKWITRATWDEGNTSTKMDGQHACRFVYSKIKGQWQMVTAHFSPYKTYLTQDK